MTFMMETVTPEQPVTAVLAVDHIGLRFDLARKLLQQGIFTMLLSDGDCAARQLGRGTGPRDAPIAIVAACRTAWGVRTLLRRVEALGWHDTSMFLVEVPEEARAEARRAGAHLVGKDVEPEDLAEAIVEQAAAA